MEFLDRLGLFTSLLKQLLKMACLRGEPALQGRREVGEVDPEALEQPQGLCHIHLLWCGGGGVVWDLARREAGELFLCVLEFLQDVFISVEDF